MRTLFSKSEQNVINRLRGFVAAKDLARSYIGFHKVKMRCMRKIVRYHLQNCEGARGGHKTCGKFEFEL